MKVSDDDIVIHAVDQMYILDWSSEETMTKWEKTNDNSKVWLQCQQCFEKHTLQGRDSLRQKGAHRKASTRS